MPDIASDPNSSHFRLDAAIKENLRRLWLMMTQQREATCAFIVIDIEHDDALHRVAGVNQSSLILPSSPPQPQFFFSGLSPRWSNAARQS